ncbi:uncharacterized protein LOC130670144 [Microplitis mediator]|uniref:uncharacterized protein LOC130670144 n=1 Tax=Microplitis mediator TaxID=375433 RepID=UPI0025574E7B|nr:uncharacterized protein LOC130670144 [Microplitis mediator]
MFVVAEKLRDLKAVTHLELLSLLSGEPVIRHPRSESLKRDEAITNAWLLYDSNILDIPNFLAYASYFLTPTYLQEHLNNMNGRTDDEEEIFEIGGIILRPMEEYFRMEVFQELNLIIENE